MTPPDAESAGQLLGQHVGKCSPAGSRRVPCMLEPVVLAAVRAGTRLCLEELSREPAFLHCICAFSVLSRVFGRFVFVSLVVCIIPQLVDYGEGISVSTASNKHGVCVKCSRIHQSAGIWNKMSGFVFPSFKTFLDVARFGSLSAVTLGCLFLVRLAQTLCRPALPLLAIDCLITIYLFDRKPHLFVLKSDVPVNFSVKSYEKKKR